MAPSDMQAPISAANLDRAASAPEMPLSSHIGELSRPTFSKSALSSEALPATSSSKGKAMQLGANKMPGLGMLANELAEEALAGDDPWDTGKAGPKSAFSNNPWGSEDLIDVNADDDDWSELQ